MLKLAHDLPKYDQEAGPLPGIDLHEFRKVVETRRSVRYFDGSAVPEAVMKDCLQLALLAPNTSNLQPWEFHWVHSPIVQQKLKEFCMGQAAAATAAELVVVVARTATWKQNCKAVREQMRRENVNFPKPFDVYYTKIVPLTYTNGPLNIIGMLRRVLFTFMRWRGPMSRPPTSPREMILWATKSCALAAQNFMLAVRAHGYDTCAMEGFDPTRVRRLLDLPKDAYITMVIGVGKRAAADQVFGPRLRLDSSLFLKKH